MNGLATELSKMADMLFETYGKQCPKCGSDLFRPRVINRDTGKKMAGACMACGYREPLTTASIKPSQIQIERQSRKKNCMDYLANYSVVANFNVFNNKFKNFQASNSEQVDAIRIAKKISTDVSLGRTVHGNILGKTGRGKTHLATGIIYDLMDKTQYTSKIVFVDLALLNEISYDAINNQDSKKKLQETTYAVKNADFVVLDDVGTERDTDWGKHFIDEVARYREDMSFLITSNLGSSDFNNRYAERTLSRLRTHTKGYSFRFRNSEDYRLARA